LCFELIFMKILQQFRCLVTTVLRVSWRHFDTIALFLMMISVCNVGLSLSDQPIGRDGFNSLDESWEVDLIYKASQGIWSGRDFMFTYGPLWQALASALPRAAGLSAGSVFKLLYLFSYWSSFVLAFLAARLVLYRSEAWQRAVYLIALIVFWLPVDPRVAFALFSFAAFLRLVEDLPVPQGRLLWRCLACSLLLTASYLLAMDAGALSTTALGVIVVSNLLLNWRTQQLARTLWFVAGTAAFTSLWILAVNTWAGGPLNFQFWSWSLQMTSAYRWLMPSPLVPEAALRLACTVGIAAVIFTAAWFTRDAKSESVTMRPLFLTAGLVFSCIALQKGVVRSGWGQISQSVLPLIALSGMILIGYRKATRLYLSRVTLLTAVALTLLFSGPANLFDFSSILGRMLWTPPPYPACPPGTYYLDQACFLSKEYETYGLPSAYIRQHSAPSDSILVYPYQNVFGLLSRRRVSAGVLQNYAIGGARLTDLQISTLERERPPLGIYCADGIVSWPVDEISNFQRTAPVWLYLQSHYTSEAEPASGVVVLRRDEARAGRMQRTHHELWRRAASQSGSVSVTIDPSRWLPARADFLHLKLRQEYSPLWKISKPSGLFVTLQFADGSSKAARLSVDPGGSGEVWIYPWEELNLKNYFGPDANRWKPDGRPLPAVQSLQIRATPYDVLSVMPRSLDIDLVEGIELSLKNK